MKRIFALASTLILGLLSASTALANDAVLGAILGGGAGALVGRSIGGRDGTIVGGAIGAAAGAAIGSESRRERVVSNYGEHVQVYYAPPVQRVYYSAPPVYYTQPVRVVAPPVYYVRERGHGARHWDHRRDWERHDRGYGRYDDR